MSNTPMEEGLLFNIASLTNSSGTSATQKNINQKGLRVGMNIIGGATGDSLTVTVFGRDVTAQTYTLLASAAQSSGFTELLIYPGCSAVVNSILNAPLPPSWGVFYTASASGTSTMGVQISYAYEN